MWDLHIFEEWIYEWNRFFWDQLWPSVIIEKPKRNPFSIKNDSFKSVVDPFEFSIMITVQYYFFPVGGNKFLKKMCLKKKKKKFSLLAVRQLRIQTNISIQFRVLFLIDSFFCLLARESWGKYLALQLWKPNCHNQETLGIKQNKTEFGDYKPRMYSVRTQVEIRWQLYV